MRQAFITLTALEGVGPGAKRRRANDELIISISPRKEGDPTMSKARSVYRVVLLLVAVMVVPNPLPGQSPEPSGRIAIESTSISAGIGVNWGDGTLSFKGKEYKFSVRGLSLVDFGISQASAVGEVYNLTDVSDLEGNYVAGEAGFALGGGMSGISMRNQNGVVIYLRSVSTGARLQLGPSGLAITLKN